MKTLIATTAVAFALTVPAFAERVTSVEEYLAMSNNSAAELVVEETSEGSIDATEVKIALSAMSAAERQVFFEADDATRSELIAAKMKLEESKSPAEKTVTN